MEIVHIFGILPHFGKDGIVHFTDIKYRIYIRMHNLVDNQARARDISTTTNNWLLYFTVENAWKILMKNTYSDSKLQIHAIHSFYVTQSDENKVKVFVP